jgi:hypothetical protein
MRKFEFTLPTGIAAERLNISRQALRDKTKKRAIEGVHFVRADNGFFYWREEVLEELVAPLKIVTYGAGKNARRKVVPCDY